MLFVLAAAAFAVAEDTLVSVTTNDAANRVVSFKLTKSASGWSLPIVQVLPTGGSGGAGGNAGILQSEGNLYATVDNTTNSLRFFERFADFLIPIRKIDLPQDCPNPDSVALVRGSVYIVGASCALSYNIFTGAPTGYRVAMPDNSAAQIVVGKSWAAVTLKSGAVLKLPLLENGGLAGTAISVALPPGTTKVPFGADFDGDLLGFTPAHDVDQLALVSAAGDVFPIAALAPGFPAHAACWLKKGPRSIWYAGDSPGHAVLVAFTDGTSGNFNPQKVIALPGSPTDVAISSDNKVFAVIYTKTDGTARVAAFAVDERGDLTFLAESDAVPNAASAFSGVTITR